MTENEPANRDETSGDQEKDPMKRWKLLPEARHHRILFIAVVLIVLGLTLKYVFGLF